MLDEALQKIIDERTTPWGITVQSVEMRDIEVVCDAWGRPALRLHGEVDEEFSRSVPDASVHLSISHDGDVAIAYVVIDRVMP